MLKELPEVEFILAWQNYRVGAVIRPAAMLRGWLLANGYVRYRVPLPTPPAPVSVSPEVPESPASSDSDNEPAPSRRRRTTREYNRDSRPE